MLAACYSQDNPTLHQYTNQQENEHTHTKTLAAHAFNAQVDFSHDVTAGLQPHQGVVSDTVENG